MAGEMTRALAPLYVAAGMVSGLWLAPGPVRPDLNPLNGPRKETVPTAPGHGPALLAGAEMGNLPPPAGAQEGGILSQLDAIDARISALQYPDPRHCDDACLTGVERVELRRGAVSCRCRRLPSLGVHRLPEVP